MLRISSPLPEARLAAVVSFAGGGVDLHCHSNASDGVLTPAQVVARARQNGVRLLALTDHDTLDGLDEAFASARAHHGLRLLAGVEISASFCDASVHIVGLDVDAGNATLRDGLQRVREGRAKRAERIAAAIEAALGVRGALAGAMRFAQNPAVVGRAHFARWMVEQGFGQDETAVFQHYLNPGKPGYVAHDWVSVPDAVVWIQRAGGVPVLAHPGRLRLGQKERDALFRTFAGAGGAAVEVVCSAHDDKATRRFARLAHGLRWQASVGSDFHAPGKARFDLGTCPPLPPGQRPIWTRWLEE